MVNDRTKKMYVSCYQKLLNYGFYPDISFNELTKIINEFNIKDTTKANYYKALIYYNKTNKDVLNDILYVEIQNDLKNINNKAVLKAKKGELSSDKMKNYMRWEDIKDAFIELQTTEKDIFNIALVSVYILNPPRRIKDYQLMIYMKRRPSVLDENFNYFIDTKNPYFIFCNYKTKKTYSCQEIPINEDLYKILKDYVNIYNIKSKSSLFKLEENNFIQKLRKIFFELTSKYISVNLLRHSYISYQTKNNFINLALEREKLAYNMGHSLTQSINYFINESLIE